jgi:hypothetical protein
MLICADLLAKPLTLADHALRVGIGQAKPLLPLAGVLLGKTSLNSLYGLIGGPPQTVPQFWLS